jgi:hypothetical protein
MTDLHTKQEVMMYRENPEHFMNKEKLKLLFLVRRYEKNNRNGEMKRLKDKMRSQKQEIKMSIRDMLRKLQGIVELAKLGELPETDVEV